MYNEEPRHIYLALSVGLLFISPILLFILPQTLINLFQESTDTWVTVATRVNYFVCGAGFLLLVMSLFLLFWFDRSNWSKTASFICVCVGLWLFYSASQTFQSFSTTGIVYKTVFSNDTHRYEWSDIQELTYSLETEKKTGAYVITFDDKNQIQVNENGYIKSIRRAILTQAKENNVEIKEIKQPD
ncbi:hypothetical protein MHI18_03885 [Peribacillus sp. FSL H8-0477]|uniref:hypothetical protein n=1 Tax=Peribacillus sp. FSL H8-0477 TaxID=2921388 RepID=UPI0030F9B3B8